MNTPLTLTDLIESVPADQVEQVLWAEAFENRAFIRQALQEMGCQGGTIHQVRDYVLDRKRELSLPQP